MTVAIVDAQDNPDAEADLQVYRSFYGLPECTTANGCFLKVAQDGSTNYPAPDPGWGLEESLDVDMVSAVCPNCKIILVEANSASNADLGAAVNEAVALGANAISNSYGGSEDGNSASDSSQYYEHPGVAITASAGDGGYGVEFPASSQYVTAVGGTSLTKDSSARGWSETVWGSGSSSASNGGTGSGCSAEIAKPSWQKDAGCTKRMVADVAAVADPNTGVAVYDSTPYQGLQGWSVLGGTSVASPIMASVYALAGNMSTVEAAPGAASIYANTGSLFDVTSGSNGTCSKADAYFCTGEVGYDGPTGNGTPNGLAAF